MNNNTSKKKNNVEGRVITKLSSLWLHLSRLRKIQFGFLIILFFVASIFEVISIGAVIPFIASLSSPEIVFEHKFAQPFISILKIAEPKDLVIPLTIIFIFITLISAAIRIILVWAQTRYSHAIGADFSIRIYRLTLFQPYLAHLNRNSSELISGITTKVNTVAFHVILPFITILSSLMILSGILVLIISINPFIAIGSFSLFGFIYLIIMLISKKKLAYFSEIISIEQVRVIKALQEGFGGIRDVILDNSQDIFVNIFKKAELPMRRAIAGVHIISFIPRYGIEAFGMIAIALIAVFSVNANEAQFSAVIPLLATIALGAQRVLPLLQLTYSSWTTFLGNEWSLKDVIAFLDQEMPDQDDLMVKDPLPFRKELKIKNLKFRYSDDHPWVLNGINLTISKGERIGIMGETGSGKSTLVDLLLGLLDPSEGEILVDQNKITRANKINWQKNIAHVPQQIFLADSSIAENIAFGIDRDLIDQEKIHNAAKRAKISDVIDSLEGKYDAFVGERGIKLSGGQRQRIGIARALYKNANVILLDEATSALDNQTEQIIMSSIENLSKDITFIIIAHRLSTLRNCSKVFELANGKLLLRDNFKNILDLKKI